MPHRLILALPATLVLALPGLAAEGDPPGAWSKPPADGRPWKHAGTGLSFPQVIGTHRLAGEFRFQGTRDVFVRYESEEERSRSDIFLFPHPAPPAERKGIEEAVVIELESVVRDFEGMVSEGRYKNLQTGPLDGGDLDLWKQDPIPFATRTLTAARIVQTKEGQKEVPVVQWAGVTFYKGHRITIRHTRSAGAGEAGQKAMETFVGSVFQVIKDPSLRPHVRSMADVYAANPFSKEGTDASMVVLAYLDQTPWFPVIIPEALLTRWKDHCEKTAPGTEAHLLRAYMVGAAKAALDDGDAEACLKGGADQLAAALSKMRDQWPQAISPEMQNFAAAHARGEGAQWIKARAR